MRIRVPIRYIGRAVTWFVILTGLAYGLLSLSHNPTATLVAMVVVGLIVVGLVVALAFLLGSWWSRKLMESGAEIALKAQVSDDNRDRAQIAALTQYGREIAKQFGGSRSSQQAALGPGPGGRAEVEYPALLPYSEFEEIPIARPGGEESADPDEEAKWMQ